MKHSKRGGIRSGLADERREFGEPGAPGPGQAPGNPSPHPESRLAPAGHRPDGTLAGESLVEQFDQACANVVEALAAAGGRPEDLVSMQIFVTDANEYRSCLGDVGEVYRRHFGPHYPAMAMLEVGAL